VRIGPRVRKLLGALAGIGIGALLGIGLANTVVMPRLTQHGVTVQVPSLAGMSIEEARLAAERAGLVLVEGDKRHSDDAPPGTVVGQTPAVGEAVKRGRGLRVTTSLGRERVTVPALRGMTLRQASLQLANSQLVLGRVSRLHTPPAGETVRATWPPEGAETALGDSIDCLVTLGSPNGPWLVPSLVGQAVTDVRALVEARGFALGRVTLRPGDGVFPGTVLEQYPPRGAWIRRGESIDLVVAESD
jgi:serine/threonine-protein kinase